MIIITQARIGSTRFKSKVLKEIDGKSILEIHLERLKKAKFKDIIVATTTEEGAEEIVKIAKKLGVNFFIGSTDDVLDRYYKCSLDFKPDYVVRVTSDCPLIDHKLIEDIVDFTLFNKLKYCTNTFEEMYPDGQDVEVMSFDALQKAWESTSKKIDREHVTPFIKRNSTFLGGNLFKSDNYKSKINYNNIRMTVDYPEDFEAIKILIHNLGIENNWENYTNFIINNIKYFKNQSIFRNDGYKEYE